ncbi:hypothetical protein A3B45_01575 [Candidatus Daviesbacteria bacterium RIFCSPLOWO2_01_FULL_39_12]|uniref:Uncharacterized protein n=1 Tax=Candidatus Daviesbacteria bacterium RIFCSPLOWO2_01_FULL_39_12 TaxID=1797785 RepID=A0A1F5KNQ3_9BACT|nr:MAG: hypothetical protein A3D79_02740 [Candidatus Daviesbacteria bacterium RIFCSPHIGHO2_02_FULL_39_8]OGE42474.1 MAG: hypothetical protein A3B45_01575 [Candidatus Daviesbacteria bacterium RIFCSPLOWO2_01_FULL_39_12]
MEAHTALEDEKWYKWIMAEENQKDTQTRTDSDSPQENMGEVMDRLESTPLEHYSTTVGEGDGKIVLLLHPTTIKVPNVKRTDLTWLTDRNNQRGRLKTYLWSLDQDPTKLGEELDLTYHMYVFAMQKGFRGIVFLESVSPSEPKTVLSKTRQALGFSNSSYPSCEALNSVLYYNLFGFRLGIDLLDNLPKDESGNKERADINLPEEYGMDNPAELEIFDPESLRILAPNAVSVFELKDRNFIGKVMMHSLEEAKKPYQPLENPIGKTRNQLDTLKGTLK